MKSITTIMRIRTLLTERFCFGRVVRGFSLIELLVVVAIFAMISGLILANHSRFNSSVLLGSLAYNIALSIREAQVYGLSVRQFSDENDFNYGFQIGYGVHFDDAENYTLFADVAINGNPPNKLYDEGIDPIIQTYSVGRGHVITGFCGEKAAESHCTDGSTSITIDHLDVVFFRPEPDAYISSDEPGYYSRAVIVVASPNQNTRSITVASTGQITVSSNE